MSLPYQETNRRSTDPLTEKLDKAIIEFGAHIRSCATKSNITSAFLVTNIAVIVAAGVYIGKMAATIETVSAEVVSRTAKVYSIPGLEDSMDRLARNVEAAVDRQDKEWRKNNLLLQETISELRHRDHD